MPNAFAERLVVFSVGQQTIWRAQHWFSYSRSLAIGSW